METKYPNWFEQTAKNNFETVLSEYKDKPNLRFMQIGAFTGDASVWLFENILTHPSSTLVDVDTWRGSNEGVHKAMDFEDIFNTYLHKTDDYEYKRRIVRAKSEDFLMSDEYRFYKPYDFIYIDGDHTAKGVIADAVMAWSYLKPNGILAFDDYTWTSDDNEDLHAPKSAINFFYWAYQEHLEVLLRNNQFWVRKI